FPDPITEPIRFACRGQAPSEVRAIDTSDPSHELTLDDSGAVRRDVWNLAPMLAVGPDRLPAVFEPMLSPEPTPMEYAARLQARLHERTGTALAGARLVFARPMPARPNAFPDAPLDKPWIAWSARTDGEGRIDFRWLEPDVPIVAYAEVHGRFVCFLHEA